MDVKKFANKSLIDTYLIFFVFFGKDSLHNLDKTVLPNKKKVPAEKNFQLPSRESKQKNKKDMLVSNSHIAKSDFRHIIVVTNMLLKVWVLFVIRWWWLLLRQLKY
jgi:hypothetical protein